MYSPVAAPLTHRIDVRGPKGLVRAGPGRSGAGPGLAEWLFWGWSGGLRLGLVGWPLWGWPGGLGIV
jgi:hypothetical protein